MADFNGDSKADLVAANFAADSVSLLRSTSRPRIASLSPSAAWAGATVMIKGWGFGATRGTSTVTFGSKAVTKYVSWSKSTLMVKVPSLLAGGKAVRVRTVDGRSNAVYFTVR